MFLFQGVEIVECRVELGGELFAESCFPAAWCAKNEDCALAVAG